MWQLVYLWLMHDLFFVFVFFFGKKNQLQGLLEFRLTTCEYGFVCSSGMKLLMFLKSFKAGPMNLDLVHTFLVRLSIRINSRNLLFNSMSWPRWSLSQTPSLKCCICPRNTWSNSLHLQSGKYCNSLQPYVYLQFFKTNCLGISASQPCGKTPENLDGETNVTNKWFSTPYLSDLNHNLIPFSDHPFQINK